MQVNAKEIVLTAKNEMKNPRASTQQGNTNTRKIGEKKLSLQEQMLMDAINATKLETPSKSVDIYNIVPKANIDKENPIVSDNCKPNKSSKIEEL
jgi:hypothetical protein